MYVMYTERSNTNSSFCDTGTGGMLSHATLIPPARQTYILLSEIHCVYCNLTDTYAFTKETS